MGKGSFGFTPNLKPSAQIGCPATQQVERLRANTDTADTSRVAHPPAVDSRHTTWHARAAIVHRRVTAGCSSATELDVHGHTLPNAF
jgi:hypothetical protein